MYSFKSNVRYSEVDSRGVLPLSSIVNYFQDCSTMQSETINQGVEAMIKRNRGWFLSAWQIDLERLPRLSEDIIIGTWPHSFKGFYGERNYCLLNSAGEMLAKANTIWSLIDLDTGHPAKITDEDMRGYALEPKADMDYLPRKIKAQGDWEIMESFKVKRCNIDTNKHVNNGQYIQMAEEYIPSDKIIKRMRAEYKTAAVYGDIIVPKITAADDRYVIQLCSSEDKIFCIVEFETQK